MDSERNGAEAMQKSLAEMVYEELKRRVLSKEYDVDELLSAKKIAIEFKVSITPVREALNRLCQEGYVVRYPSFGYIIRDMSYQEVKEIFELRFILESAAIRLIIRYASDEEIRTLYEYIGVSESTITVGHGKNTTFHWELGKLSKNTYLSDDIMRLVMSIARPSKYLDSSDYLVENETTYHTGIVDALLARDVEKALDYLKCDVLYGKHRDLE